MSLTLPLTLLRSLSLFSHLSSLVSPLSSLLSPLSLSSLWSLLSLSCLSLVSFVSLLSLSLFLCPLVFFFPFLCSLEEPYLVCEKTDGERHLLLAYEGCRNSLNQQLKITFSSILSNRAPVPGNL